MSDRFPWLEWQRELRRNYPSLFRGADKSLQECLMPFGCEHGAGWANIVGAVCEVLARHDEALQLPEEERIELVQVKEKLGELRIYLRGYDDYCDGVTETAERLSLHTCEICGASGRLRGPGWLTTRCDEHAEGREALPWNEGWLTWTIGDDDVPILREVPHELRGLPEPTARAANVVSYEAARKWADQPELSSVGLDERGELRFAFETLKEVPDRQRAGADLARAFARVSSL